MLIGCYYRCPVPFEEHDSEYPRFFVLAQVIQYNEIADMVKVKMYDLLGSREYYNSILSYTIFSANVVSRCEAIPGGIVACKWGQGTVISKVTSSIDENKPYWYWIKLKDGTIHKICETDLQIEYSQMNFAPDQQLKNYEFQNPSWFINHMKVSRNLNLVNNATYGFNILAGCRAYLLPHQITTITRCFETLPIRYMLADEVGLGKTVEACSILSILANDNINFRCILVVPAALVSQWMSELKYKYKIEASLTNPDKLVYILPMEELEKTNLLNYSNWNMLIVDETHRLLKKPAWYEQIKFLSERIENVLLLSATPIQDRNEEYHQLLTLLNPKLYGDMTAECFANLVKKQKKIQIIANQQLNRMRQYEDYYELIADKLKEIAESLEDKRLNRLLSQLDLTSEDKGEDQAKQILSYICENYRLERNIIRNRRQFISTQMPKRSLIEIPYTPLTLNENYNEVGVIQNTLSYLTEYGVEDKEYVSNVAIPLLSALFSSPWALEETIKDLNITDEQLNASVQAWKQQAKSEIKHADYALDEDPDEIKGRFLIALDYLDQYLNISGTDIKVVIFTAHNATMNVFLKLLNKRYKNSKLYAVGFGKRMSRADLDDSVYLFQNDPNCRFIVCDETGGEGRNFQNAAYVIHLDIPWNVNDLEQRIGRLDRLGRDPDKDVCSIVLYTEGTIEEQLLHIWRDGFGIFDHSLSGLEIISGELNSLIIDALLDDYSNGLNNAFDDILDQVEEMRESVEDEKDFDIGTTLYRPLSDGVEHVLDLYAEDSNNIFATAMLSWGSQVGLNANQETDTKLITFYEKDFSVRAAMQALYVPPLWETYKSSSIMKRQGKIIGTFDRSVAASREDVLFYAPGDSVYDSIIFNALGCSRGRCSAIGTYGPFDYDGLIYIYNIEPEYDLLLESGMGLQVLSQYRMYLPLNQIIISLPLNSSSKNVPENDVIKLLFSLNAEKVDHLGKRSRSRSSASPLEKFICMHPQSEWIPLVESFTKRANKMARKKMVEDSDLKKAKNEMLRILDGYRAECIYFERDTSSVNDKFALYNQTYNALKSSKPILDSVCYLKVNKYEY